MQICKVKIEKKAKNTPFSAKSVSKICRVAIIVVPLHPLFVGRGSPHGIRAANHTLRKLNRAAVENSIELPATVGRLKSGGTRRLYAAKRHPMRSRCRTRCRTRRCYRLAVRTKDSQSLNRGSIPRSTTPISHRAIGG